MESLSGSPSSVIIWSRSLCVRRGGLAAEDGGWCRWAGGGGGGVGNLLLWQDDPRPFGLCAGGSRCLGEALCVGAVFNSKKTSRAASPPLMVRMCVGPCGEGANWTLHLVSGGGQSAARGVRLGHFVVVAVSRRGVGILASRLVIDVMTKPCDCCS